MRTEIPGEKLMFALKPARMEKFLFHITIHDTIYHCYRFSVYSRNTALLHDTVKTGGEINKNTIHLVDP